jgi:signal transduction histidine kinase
MLNLQTLVILFSSALTGIISVAMLLVVFWQAPRAAINQSFALLMLVLALYAILNPLIRLVDPLEFSPKLAFSLTTFVYVCFFALLYYFTETYGRAQSRLFSSLGFAHTGLTGLLLASDNFFKHLERSVSDKGGYVAVYTLPALLTIILGFSFLLASVLHLARAHDPRLRRLLPAGCVLLFGAVMVSIRPLSNVLAEPFASLIIFPYNAIALSVAALLMGRVILQEQLFNPLHEMNRQLELSNAELEIANQQKDRFLATMSHELRTPLNAVIGYTELIQTEIYGPVNAQQKERLERITYNAHHLLSLINDVLDLSKIESDGLTLYPQKVEVLALLKQIKIALGALAEAKKLAFQLDCPPNLTLEADPKRLEQILVNLLSNAIKFTDKGFVRVRAWSQGEEVAFSVEDSGIGIPPEDLPSLFQSYQQAQGLSASQRNLGTGLGLAICKRLVEMHGGRIQVESRYGQGSRFQVFLPAAFTPLVDQTPSKAPLVSFGWLERWFSSSAQRP